MTLNDLLLRPYVTAGCWPTTGTTLPAANAPTVTFDFRHLLPSAEEMKQVRRLYLGDGGSSATPQLPPAAVLPAPTGSPDPKKMLRQ